MSTKRKGASTRTRKASSQGAPEVLAAEQGVKPIGNIDELKADFWPEDESIDDFQMTVRRWRQEGGERHVT